MVVDYASSSFDDYLLAFLLGCTKVYRIGCMDVTLHYMTLAHVGGDYAREMKFYPVQFRRLTERSVLYAH
jgi:hypothetical protein